MNPTADAARELARLRDGRFGIQHRAESLIRLDSSPDTHDCRPVETLPAADFAAQFPPSLWSDSWAHLDELADEDVEQPADEDEWEEMGAHFAWGGESGCTVEDIAESLATGNPMHRPVEVIETEDGTWGVTDGHHRVVAALRVGAPIRFVRL